MGYHQDVRLLPIIIFFTFASSVPMWKDHLFQQKNCYKIHKCKLWYPNQLGVELEWWTKH
jgi:hypothetical protein